MAVGKFFIVICFANQASHLSYIRLRPSMNTFLKAVLSNYHRLGAPSMHGRNPMFSVNRSFVLVLPFKPPRRGLHLILTKVATLLDVRP